MGIHIGTSGWSYDHWVGVLYPPRTPVRARLAAYVDQFDTVELNTSFYRWPAESAFAAWRERLPEGFRMSVKASRFLTHYRRLGDPDAWIERMTTGWRALGDRRGVLLVQLRPDHQRDDDRLEQFLLRLPSDMGVALEFRHPSWDTDSVAEMLARQRAAWVVVDGAGLPQALRVTSRTAYFRLHGPPEAPLYSGQYSDAQLDWWADTVREWREAVDDVYIYFDNDIGGHAVRDARRLRHRLMQ